MLDLLDPARRASFPDVGLAVTFGLSSVVWIATAVDPAGIPAVLLPHLEIVELPGYTEWEKLVVAEHVLKRPFAGPDDVPEGFPGPRSAAHAEGTVEAWRTAASDGGIRFEPEALRLLVSEYSNGPGVADLRAGLCEICREVVRRRAAGGGRPGDAVPAVVTPEVVADILR